MHKTLLICCIICFSASIYSQKQNNTNKKTNIGSIGIYGDSQVICTKQDSIYTFSYTEQNEISVAENSSFEIYESDFDLLYNSIINGFNNLPKEPIKVKSTKDYVSIEFQKTLGIVAFRFNKSKKENSLSPSYSTWVTKKKFDKLFGK